MQAGGRRLVSLSIDLDEIGCYRAVHGLGDGPGVRPIYDRGIPRFAELLARCGVRATFFAVGRDAATPGSGARLRDLARAGHELANHSLGHHYDLVRRPQAVMVAEVAGGRAAVEDAAGVPVRGFRAPGYTLDSRLVEVLGDLRVGYDSSVLPSPPYLIARSAAIVAKALRGRHSRSMFGGLAMGLAPSVPYLLGRPFFLRASGGEGRGAAPGTVRELPIAVVPGVRVPFIGTTLVLAGPRRAEWLCRLVERSEFVNIELHGIDLCGPDDPGVGDLVGHQPDASIPHFAKAATLELVIRRFLARGSEFVTLAEAAERLLP